MDRTDPSTKLRMHHLDQIQFELLQAEEHLARIRQRMTELEAAGMYPSASSGRSPGLPTERWKDDRYLYLYFPDGAANGLKLDAKQRLYIGADPARIEEARRRVANRRKWEDLNSIARWLDQWLKEKETDIRQIADRAKRWPRAKEELLGTENAGSSGGAGPNLGSDIRIGEAAQRPKLGS